MAEYYAGSGTTALGIIGTTLGGIAVAAPELLRNSGLGGNNTYATKESVESSVIIAAKDSEIALLKAGQETDRKLVDVYNAAAARDKSVREDIAAELKEIRASIRAEHDSQAAVNSAQAVYNCSNNSAVTLLQAQVAQLSGMTKLYITAANVTPEPMPALNSWKAPGT